MSMEQRSTSSSVHLYILQQIFKVKSENSISKGPLVSGFQYCYVTKAVWSEQCFSPRENRVVPYRSEITRYSPQEYPNSFFPLLLCLVTLQSISISPRENPCPHTVAIAKSLIWYKIFYFFFFYNTTRFKAKVWNTLKL